MDQRVNVLLRLLKLVNVVFNIGEIVEPANKPQPSQRVILENRLGSLQHVKEGATLPLFKLIVFILQLIHLLIAFVDVFFHRLVIF